ncbi:hypothetical protein KJ632_03225 [Patescibacteria group bacterium]|nr:hypothetical protein [Patescibacteria group bacterium]
MLDDGGGAKTDIEPTTKGLSQKSITVKEYLDQKEEVTEEIIPFGYSDLTKELFEMVYLDFYYWVKGNLESVEEFLRLVRDV